MKPTRQAIQALLALHTAVGDLLAVDLAYANAAGDITREPAAFDARVAARAAVAATHERVAKLMDRSRKRTVSVSAGALERYKAAAKERGISVRKLVELATEGLES